MVEGREGRDRDDVCTEPSIELHLFCALFLYGQTPPLLNSQHWISLHTICKPTSPTQNPV